MKRCWICLGLAVLLAGCGSKETFETVSDVIVQPVSGQAREVYLELPEYADVHAMGAEGTGNLYFCGDMTVCVQTMDRGDLDQTIRTATGYGKEGVRLVEGYFPDGKLYECAWTSVGEGGLQVGRTKILDDGSYHYTLTVMMPEGSAEKNQAAMQRILDSFDLVDPETDVNTGS